MKQQNKTYNKKFFIILIIFILIAAGIGILLYNVYFNIASPLHNIIENNSDPNTPSVSSITLLDEIETVLHEDDVRAYIDKNNPGKTSELISIIEDAKLQKQGSTEGENAISDTENDKDATTSYSFGQTSGNALQGGSNSSSAGGNKNAPSDNGSSDISSLNKNSSTSSVYSDNNTSSPTKPPAASGSTYERIKSQVEPKDLTAALSIAGKVDTGYILGLVGGGLTSEEKSELKSYLMEHLSSSEISKGIQLFAKYASLL